MRMCACVCVCVVGNVKGPENVRKRRWAGSVWPGEICLHVGYRDSRVLLRAAPSVYGGLLRFEKFQPLRF